MDGKPGSNTNCALSGKDSEPSQDKKIATVGWDKPSRMWKAVICAEILDTPNLEAYNLCQTPHTMPVTMEAQVRSHARDRHIQPAFQRPRTDARNSALHQALPVFKIPLQNTSLSLLKTFHSFDALQAGHELWQRWDKAEFPFDIYLCMCVPISYITPKIESNPVSTNP